METNPIRVCELLVGLPDVNVLGVDDVAGDPVRVHVETRGPRPRCLGCGATALPDGNRRLSRSGARNRARNTWGSNAGLTWPRGSRRWMRRRTSTRPWANQRAHVEAVQDVGGVTHMLFDCGPIRLGAVGDHDFDASAPAVADHTQHCPGVAVHQHCHVTVTAPQAGLVDQQHPTAGLAAMPTDPVGPRAHQTHHEMPRQAMTPRQLPDGQMPGVPHDGTAQTPGHLALELGMILSVTHPTVLALEAALQPHQRRRTTQRQILNLDSASLMHLRRFEPTRWAAQHAAGVRDLHHQPIDLVLDHPHHPDPPQMQPDHHPIRSHPTPPPQTTRSRGSPNPPHNPRIRAVSDMRCLVNGSLAAFGVRLSGFSRAFSAWVVGPGVASIRFACTGGWRRRGRRGSRRGPWRSVGLRCVRLRR